MSGHESGESRARGPGAGLPCAYAAAVAEAEARKGNAPGREKPKKARGPHVERSGDGEPQPAEG
jgi:hypothetical protein